MIESADEFVRLRSSTVPVEYTRAAEESADMATWLEVIERFPDMREWVAHNKSVPHAILAILATDPAPEVRQVVAGKRKLLPETMMILVEDPDENFRASLAGNPKLTPAARAALAADPNAWVRT